MIIYEVMQIIRTPEHGQNILCIFLKKFQHVSELSLPLLKYPDQQAPHLGGYYHVYLHTFLVEHDCSLEFSFVNLATIKCRNDLMIMDLACSKLKNILNDAEIKKIHYCRSYLQLGC